MRVEYTNPLKKNLQHEYAMILAVSTLFHTVIYNSMCFKTLKLYYADLVTENKETFKPNYNKQKEVKEKMEQIVERDVKGKIKFPDAHRCIVTATVKTGKSGRHEFVFSDGIYKFSLKLVGSPNKDNLKIIVNNKAGGSRLP